MQRLKPKSEFTRNILILMTGTTIAQAIPIVISPILTRFYSPADFGIFALFMSLTSILVVIATGKYDLSIILPSKNSDSRQLVVLSVIISLIFSFIVLIIIVLFYSDIELLNSNVSTLEWLYLLPLSILLTSGYQVLIPYENRSKNYKKISMSLIFQNITTAMVNILTILITPTFWGLIFAKLIGITISIFFLLLYNKSQLLKVKVSFTRILHLAKRYKKFPIFSLPADLSSIITNELPILLFVIFYSNSILGLYALAMRVVAAPISIIGSSISNVFRREAAHLYNVQGSCTDLYLKTFKYLFFLSIIPFTVFGIYSPDIFSFVFGEEWKTSGEFTQIMAIMFFFKFIVSPLSYMFYIAEKQVEDLYLHVYVLISSFISIYLGYILFKDPSYSILFYSFNWVLIYIYTGIRSYQFSKGNIT